MSVLDVMGHDLWAVDAEGSRCTCGTVSVSSIAHLEHLADVALLAMGSARLSMPVVALIVQPPCSAGDCDRVLYARGMCAKHYHHEYHLSRERRAA